MKIRFLVSISGSEYSHQRGDVADWDDESEAARFFDKGIAEPVVETPKPPRRATKKRPADE